MKHTITSDQQGFTLIELLIGLLVGLFIIGISVAFLVTSSRTLVNQSTEDLIQENVRFAFEILSSNIRLMGFNDAPSQTIFSNVVDTSVQGIFSTPICEGNMTNCTADSVNYHLNGQTIDSDSVAFDYILDNGTTCTGNPVTQEVKVVTVFFVDDIDGDGIASLNCRSFESQRDSISQNFIDYQEPQPALAIIDGIDSMQVQYGVDVDADNAVERYVTYNNLIAIATPPNVRAIKIGFLANSGQAIAEDRTTERNIVGPQNYQVLDGLNIFNDIILRQIYTTTIFLPNRT